jgi:cyclic nucleotide gated channel alpha 1
MTTGSFNRLARFARIGKLYKLIKMARMAKVLKIAKIKNKFMKNMVDMLKISAGFERLMILAIVFLLLQHVVCCIWIFIARFNPGTKENWIYVKYYSDMGNLELYVTSFYFTTTTILTVGYGDITPVSVAEKLLCIFLMIIGVVSFSFATGALSSIIQNVDSSDAALKEKIATLNSIQAEYNIDSELYNKCIKTLRYDMRKKSKDFILFLDELPYKIKIELATEIHKH